MDSIKDILIIIIIIHYVQTLKEEQDREIESLERRLETARFQHEDRIRGMKAQFLRKKKAHEESINGRIQSMAVEASKVLVTSLSPSSFSCYNLAVL